MATRTLAVMFTDIKGFTERTSEVPREELRDLLSKHDSLLRPTFAAFRGRVVKTIGDAFLVVFESPTDAVVCGMAVQEVLRKHNAAVAEDARFHVRVAINVGDVEERGSDVFGEAVNLASRLEGIAEADEVWFTEAVYLTMNRHEAPTAEVGERTFKGIPHPVRIYKVIDDPGSEQVKRLAERIEVRDGRPVIDGQVGVPVMTGAMPAAPRRAGAHRLPGGALLVGMLAIALAIASLPVIGSLVAKKKAQTVHDEARALVTAGKHEQALSRLDVALDGGRKSRPRLEELAILAAGARADEIEEQEGPKAALEWLSEQVSRKPYLDPLRRSRLPRLDTVVAMIDANDKGEPLEVPLRRMLEKYPDDPGVPYIGARIMQSKRGALDAYVLQFYEMALERGGYAGDARIWSLVVETWEDFGPQARWSRDAHRIAKKHYAEDRRRWAEKAFDEGGAPAWLNAMTILSDDGDARAKDPMNVALRDALSGKVDAGRAALAAETDPAKRARYASLLRSAVKNQTMSLGDLDPAENLAKELSR